MGHKASLWRSTPPAIFPLALGFMGMALAWRNAANIWMIPSAIGDLLLGLATAYFAFFALSYLAKIIARPSAILDDLKMPPARAGVAALPMTMMLVAVALLPFGIEARAFWLAAVVLFYLMMVLTIYALVKGPVESRKFSPFQYLTFVGPIVAPIAGVPLGFEVLSYWMTITALIAYLVITIGYGAKLIRVRPPVPLRPSLVIVLSPTALFAMAFYQFEIWWAYTLFWWLSLALALVFNFLAYWLTEDGYTPMWGSFIFPVAAFTNLQLMTLSYGPNFAASVLAIAGLLIGTTVTAFVLWKSSKLWMRGELAKKTGAAVA